MSARRVEVTEAQDLAAPAADVWAYLLDWDRQGEWMLGTRVTLTAGDGRTPGSTICAVTGLGPLGVRDPMTVTEVRPPPAAPDQTEGAALPAEPTPGDPAPGETARPGGPGRCVVRHTGAVVRGEGVFEVQPLDETRCRFRWTERLDLPLGRAGAVGWALVRPVFRAGLRRSLRALARVCRAGSVGGRR